MSSPSLSPSSPARPAPFGPTLRKGMDITYRPPAPWSDVRAVIEQKNRGILTISYSAPVGGSIQRVIAYISRDRWDSCILPFTHEAPMYVMRAPAAGEGGVA